MPSTSQTYAFFSATRRRTRSSELEAMTNIKISKGRVAGKSRCALESKLYTTCVSLSLNHGRVCSGQYNALRRLYHSRRLGRRRFWITPQSYVSTNKLLAVLAQILALSKSDVYARKLDVLNRGLSGYNTDWAIPVLEQVSTMPPTGNISDILVSASQLSNNSRTRQKSESSLFGSAPMTLV